jgi:hypothetical protein
MMPYEVLSDISHSLSLYVNNKLVTEICAVGKEALSVYFKGYLLLLEVSFLRKLRCC